MTTRGCLSVGAQVVYVPRMRTCSALLVLVLLLPVGCGGSPSGGSTTPAPTSRVLVALTHSELGEQDADPPRSMIALVVTDPDGNATTTQLAEVTGLCRPLVPTQGVLASQHCWHSGSGVRIHVRQERDELLIGREELTESSNPDALNAPIVQRFALAPGTAAQAADTGE
jgi:hypothetical protein